MPYKFFTIPVRDVGLAEEALNGFLRSHKVLSVDRRWVEQGDNSYWSFCIDYLETRRNGEANRPSERTNVDYKEVLSAEDFAVFARLRDLRKGLAQEEAVPVYTIFTNEQLAQMVQQRVKSKQDLEAIPGVGETRIVARPPPPSVQGHFRERQELPVGGSAIESSRRVRWAVARLGPGEPGRQLEQHRQELPDGDPQQEHADEPEQQPGLPRGLSSAGGVEAPPDGTDRPPAPPAGGQNSCGRSPGASSQNCERSRRPILISRRLRHEDFRHEFVLLGNRSTFASRGDNP